MDPNERKKIIMAADLAKLHSEVNQLRNQEFLIPSAVLVLIATIFNIIDYTIFTPLIMLLGLIYYWFYTLHVIRTRITQYLIVSQQSFWEYRYRKFADLTINAQVGQKKTVSLLFQIVAVGIYIYTTLNLLYAYLDLNTILDNMSGCGLIVRVSVAFVLSVIVFALSRSVIDYSYDLLLSYIRSQKQTNKSLFYPLLLLLLLLLSLLLILISFGVDRNTLLSWTPMFKFGCWIGLNTASLVHYYKVIQVHNNPQTVSLNQIRIRSDWKNVIEMHTQNSIIFGNESENLPT